MPTLGERELVCAEVLFEKGVSQRKIAEQLRVDESTDPASRQTFLRRSNRHCILD